MLKAVAKIIYIMAAVYGLLFLVALAFEPVRRGDHVGLVSSDSDGTIYSNSMRFDVYGTTSLRRAKGPQIFLIGGSVVQWAFSPDVLAEKIATATVHNVANGYANVTQTRELVQDMLELLDDATVRQSVFVIGSHFISMIPNEVKFKANGGISYYTVEKLRHGLYHADSAGRIVPSVPRWMLEPAVVALKPLLLIYAAKYWLDMHMLEWKNVTVYTMLRALKGLRHEEWSFTPKTGGELRSLIAGSCSEDNDYTEQYAELAGLASELRGRGAAVVIVDMPVLNDITSLCPEYARYRRSMTEFVQTEAIPYIDMHDAVTDRCFGDGFHVGHEFAPETTRILADRLGSVLRTAGF